MDPDLVKQQNEEERISFGKAIRAAPAETESPVPFLAHATPAVNPSPSARGMAESARPSRLARFLRWIRRPR